MHGRAAGRAPGANAAFRRGGPAVGDEGVGEAADGVTRRRLTLQRYADANRPPRGIEDERGTAGSRKRGGVVARRSIGGRRFGPRWCASLRVRRVSRCCPVERRRPRAEREAPAFVGAGIVLRRDRACECQREEERYQKVLRVLRVLRETADPARTRSTLSTLSTFVLHSIPLANRRPVYW